LRPLPVGYNRPMTADGPIILSTFGSPARYGYRMDVHCWRCQRWIGIDAAAFDRPPIAQPVEAIGPASWSELQSPDIESACSRGRTPVVAAGHWAGKPEHRVDDAVVEADHAA